MNKQYGGFSLAELLVSMALIGTLLVMLSTKLLKQLPDVDKTRLKKTYVLIERTVSSLINNDVLYPGRLGFRNTDAVVTTVGDQFGVGNEKTKFRDSFKYYMNVFEEDVDCGLYSLGNSNKCFRTSDNVVIGIPDTDFVNSGTVTSGSGKRNKYVPITLYTSFDKGKKTPSVDAFVIGVRFDGKLKILNTDGCDRFDIGDSRTPLRCKTEAFLESSSIKK